MFQGEVAVIKDKFPQHELDLILQCSFKQVMHYVRNKPAITNMKVGKSIQDRAVVDPILLGVVDTTSGWAFD